MVYALLPLSTHNMYVLLFFVPFISLFILSFFGFVLFFIYIVWTYMHAPCRAYSNEPLKLLHGAGPNSVGLKKFKAF